MGVPIKFIKHQGPMLAAMGRIGLRAAFAGRPGEGLAEAAARVPPMESLVSPLPEDLIACFRGFCGGTPSDVGTVPPTLWPQWGLPMFARQVMALGLPAHRILNGSSLLRVRSPLPAGVPLVARTRLIDVNATEKRIIITQGLTTGPQGDENALEAEVTGIMPLRSGSKRNKGVQENLIPFDAEALRTQMFSSRAGLDFALLTGDFNPIHLSRTYGRLMGLKGSILHGFALLGLAHEALAASDNPPAEIRIRFVKPLRLPGRVSVFRTGDAFFVGKAPGAQAIARGDVQGAGCETGSTDRRYQHG